MLARADSVSCLGYDSQPIYSKSSELFYGSIPKVRGDVLDAGCGTGVQWYHILKKGKTGDAQIHCMDVFLSKHLNLYKEFVESNSNCKVIPEIRYEERMPYDDNSFDTVLHFETFAHISYPAETEVSEISRVSKPKGKVFLSVPSSDLRGCEKRSFSKKELKEILVQHGLKPKIRTYTAGELGIPNVLPDTKVTLFAECLNTKI